VKVCENLMTKEICYLNIYALLASGKGVMEHWIAEVSFTLIHNSTTPKLQLKHYAILL